MLQIILLSHLPLLLSDSSLWLAWWTHLTTSSSHGGWGRNWAPLNPPTTLPALNEDDSDPYG